jgi:AcrR family transcriptional regulator
MSRVAPNPAHAAPGRRIGGVATPKKMRARPHKRGPGRPTGNTAQATKQRIIEVAHREFADLGYAAATTPSIVQRAGVSPSVLYHHFGSKPALYTAVLKWQVDISLEAFEVAIEGKRTLRERIDATLGAQEVIWPQYGKANPILVMAPFEVRRHPELRAAREQLRRNEQFFTRLVAESDDVEEVEPGLVQTCIALIWGLSGVGAITPDIGVYLQTVQTIRRMLAGEPLQEHGTSPR